MIFRNDKILIVLTRCVFKPYFQVVYIFIKNKMVHILNAFKSDFFMAGYNTRKKEGVSVFIKFMYSQNKLYLQKCIKEISVTKQ